MTEDNPEKAGGSAQGPPAVVPPFWSAVAQRDAATCERYPVMLTCPICGLPPRVGQNPEKARVVQSDFAPDLLAKLKRDQAPAPGLYHVCTDCASLLRPALAARVNAAEGTSFTAQTLPADYMV